MTGDTRDAAKVESTNEPIQRPADMQAPRRFVRIDTEAIFAELPPTVWTCEDLGWCPGRPAMIAGYGFSGKSLAAQCAALQLAAGRSIWAVPARDGYHEHGGFPVRAPRRVLHLDYEQGRTATLRRYQRLARGLKFSREELGGRLEVVSLATIMLNDRDAFDVFARECQGFDIVFLDAFRGAVPGCDENESTVRDHLDLLTRVSEKTGVSFVTVHHAGKSKQADNRMVLRGSSAIFDACGSVLTIAGSEDRSAPKDAEHVKHAAEADRPPLEPFALAIVSAPETPREPAWIRVEYRTREQLDPKKQGEASTSEGWKRR